jgi:hypothetical protein
MKPYMTIPISVIVERSKASTAWTEFVWRPAAVLGGVPDTAPWTQIATETEVTTFYAGASQIELHLSEAESYRDNLGSDAPSVWVHLVPAERDVPYEIAAVTVDPAEGEALTAAEGVVEAVPMPDSVRDVAASFIAAHHKERVFEKRKRDRADPEALARHSPRHRTGQPS